MGQVMGELDFDDPKERKMIRSENIFTQISTTDKEDEETEEEKDYI